MRILCLLLLMALSAGPADASRRRPANPDPLPAPPRAEIVFDMAAGRIVHQANADVAVHPASLAKMMTLEILFDALERGVVRLDGTVPISPRAASMPPSRLGAPPGSTITVQQAILCLAVRSCNDVASAVGEMLSGSEEAFATLMTERARAFGLSSTRFANASGLPDARNVTTARDMLLLGATLMARHPAMWPYMGQSSWEAPTDGRVSINRTVAAHPSIDGGKTGYVAASGFNMFASALRDGRRVFVVVMGGPTAAQRDARVSSLVEATLRTSDATPLAALAR